MCLLRLGFRNLGGFLIPIDLAIYSVPIAIGSYGFPFLFSRFLLLPRIDTFDSHCSLGRTEGTQGATTKYRNLSTSLLTGGIDRKEPKLAQSSEQAREYV